MNRVRRFWENAGLRGCLVVIVLIAFVAQDLSSGQWIYTVPLLVVMSASCRRAGVTYRGPGVRIHGRGLERLCGSCPGLLELL